jgi:hypothetical protein
VDGWSAAMTTQQVLSSLEDSTLFKTPNADPNSIMCYQLPASIMTDHIAVPGGNDIDAVDYEFISIIYPKPG